MKDLLTNMFKAKDKADQELREAQKEMIEKQYQKDMDQKRAYNSSLAEQARQMRNAAAQQGLQGVVPGSFYGVNDPREQYANQVRTPSIEELHQNVAQANQTVKVLFEKVARAERKVEQLSGFYHWITEVHPELAAQYKAMRELYDAANNTGGTVPGEAMGS